MLLLLLMHPKERASVFWRDRGQVENYSKELFRGLEEEKIEERYKRGMRRRLSDVMNTAWRKLT